MKQEILGKIEESPGIHFREVQRQIGCSSTTLNYHLNELDIRERQFHGYRRFYPREVPEELQRSLAAMNHDVRGQMLCQMREGISQKDLVENMDLSKSTVSSHLKILKQDGLVREEERGRSKNLYLSQKAIDALERYASKFIEEASEGFIEMWD
jgi:predicted transcriptional regulator